MISAARFPDRPAAAWLVALAVLAGCAPVGEHMTVTGGPSPIPTAQDSSAPAVGPLATTVAGLGARVLRLGDDAAPIDVASAFGSIWTANHHDDTVSRIDPATMMEIARIKAGRGPGWFVVTGDALWVTNQNGRGLTRIDPATNSVTGSAGEYAPCWAPVAAFGSIWQPSCDAGQIMRIDPETQKVSYIGADGHLMLMLTGGELVGAGPDDLARLDPVTEKWRPIAPLDGAPIGTDGDTVWISGGPRVDDANPEDGTEVARVSPTDGTVLAKLPIAGAALVRAAGYHAWVVQANGVVEVDLETNAVLRTITIPGSILVARTAAGALWVTSFDASELWRITP